MAVNIAYSISADHQYIASNQLSLIPGTLVPRATKLRAVTLSFKPTVQPKLAATSPITAVSKPTIRIDTVKAAQPPT